MVEKDTEIEEEFVTEREDLPKDDIDLETEEALAGDKIKALREKLKACEAESREAKEEVQRVKADFLNSKRRLEEQLTRDRERAKDDIIEDLISVIDTFDSAIGSQGWKNADEVWRTGMEAIHTKLLGILKGNGVTIIDPKGSPFTPEEHEAVASKEGGEPHTVLEVLQKGYRRGETVIRPARVVIAE